MNRINSTEQSLQNQLLEDWSVNNNKSQQKQQKFNIFQNKLQRESQQTHKNNINNTGFDPINEREIERTYFEQPYFEQNDCYYPIASNSDSLNDFNQEENIQDNLIQTEEEQSMRYYSQINFLDKRCEHNVNLQNSQNSNAQLLNPQPQLPERQYQSQGTLLFYTPPKKEDDLKDKTSSQKKKQVLSEPMNEEYLQNQELNQNNEFNLGFGNNDTYCYPLKNQQIDPIRNDQDQFQLIDDFIEENESQNKDIQEQKKKNKIKMKKQRDEKNDLIKSYSSKKFASKKLPFEKRKLILKQFQISENSGFMLYQINDNKCFSIYNDCVVDLGIFSNQTDNKLIPIGSMKRVQSVAKINNGDFLQVNSTSYTPLLIDYSFLLEKVRSVSSLEAYNWYKLLLLFESKTQKQTQFIKQLLNKPEKELIKLKELFNLRKQFAFQKANNLIKGIPRNQVRYFIQYNFDFNCHSIIQTSAGYSRKLLEIIGLSINEAPGVFLRKGPLDLINRKEKVQNMLLTAIQLIDHPKSDLIDSVKGEIFIHTLDMIKIQSKISFQLINLTNQYDKLNNFTFPFGDDFLCSIVYDINEENMNKLHEVRKEKNIFNQFSLDDIIEGETEYLQDVNNFLTKYYSSSISSYKKRNHQLSGLMDEESRNQNKQNLDQQQGYKQNNLQILNKELKYLEIRANDVKLDSSFQILKASIITSMNQNSIMKDSDY